MTLVFVWLGLMLAALGLAHRSACEPAVYQARVKLAALFGVAAVLTLALGPLLRGAGAW